jgi:hypothetical protein
VVREQLRVEDDTRNVDTDGVDQQEEISCRHAHAKAGFVGGLLGEGADHCGFENERDTAARNTGDEQRLATGPVHDQGTNEISEDAHRDPTALEDKLVQGIVAESGIDGWSIVVQNQYAAFDLLALPSSATTAAVGTLT